MIFRVSGEEYRGHSIRVLLGFLASLLEEKGLQEMAAQIADYSRNNRRVLAELEEGHIRSVYGVLEYSEEQAKKLVNAAESLIRFLEKIEEGVFPA